MRRIGKNATANLDDFAPPPEVLERVTVPTPPGRAALRCGVNIFPNLDDWKAACEKREYSTRGCVCVPFKAPKARAKTVQVSLMGSDS